MSKPNFQKQYNTCEGCGGISGDNHLECEMCFLFLMAFQTSPDEARNMVAVGEGNKQEELVFTIDDEGVIDLHGLMNLEFKRSPTGRTFTLGIPLDRKTVWSIDSCYHNRVVTSLVMILSSSDAGMMSINQQTFAGYLIAYMINRLLETDKCDPIFVWVLLLELSNISGNPSSSNWSALTDFENLYNFCVQQKIIVNYEVQLVPPESDGSYIVGKVLDGKFGSVFMKAEDWVPPPPPLPYPALCASGPWSPPPALPPPPYPALCAQVSQDFPPPPLPVHCASDPLVLSSTSSQTFLVWFDDTNEPDYYVYDKQKNVLTSKAGRIIDDIPFGSYQVRMKDTHKLITIELKEVQSPASLRPSPQQLVLPESDQKIEKMDITICQGTWSVQKGLFSKSGTCMVASDRFTFGHQVYCKDTLLSFLNELYKKN